MAAHGYDGMRLILDVPRPVMVALLGSTIGNFSDAQAQGILSNVRDVLEPGDRFLMGATAALALLFTPIYLRQKHVIPLGLCHGWLGVLAYYWLLGRDPWVELFG